MQCFLFECVLSPCEEPCFPPDDFHGALNGLAQLDSRSDFNIPRAIVGPANTKKLSFNVLCSAVVCSKEGKRCL
jgi:hypothetical protein